MKRVVLFGEAMVRLTPAGGRRLEQADALSVAVGGAELNTAAALARLGHAVEWASRLPDGPLGRLVLAHVHAAGVGTTHVRPSPNERVGLYFLEEGAAPRAGRVVYDRQHSAFARLDAAEFDWDAILEGADWFHVSGITPALGPGCRAATDAALAAARRLGVPFSLDPNYRSFLWRVEDARTWLHAAVAGCRALTLSRADGETFFDIRADSDEQSAQRASQQLGVPTVAVTRREAAGVWRERLSAVAHSRGTLHRTREYDVEVVDRVGAGDCFVGGIVHGELIGDPRHGLDVALALSAVHHTVPGDLPCFEPGELDAAIAGAGLGLRR